jgi:hypothetical protein
LLLLLLAGTVKPLLFAFSPLLGDSRCR